MGRRDYVDVDVDRLVPNPWGYNEQSPERFAELVESIRKHGFTDPVVCRTLKDGSLEILAGEKAWLAARELTMGKVPVWNVGEIDDQQAMELVVVLQERGGRPDEVRLSGLLRELAETSPLEELRKRMPFDLHELRMFVGAVDFSFVKLSPRDSRPAQVAPKKERSKTPAERPSKTRIVLSLGADAVQELADVAPTFEGGLLLLLDEWERQQRERATS